METVTAAMTAAWQMQTREGARDKKKGRQVDTRRWARRGGGRLGSPELCGRTRRKGARLTEKSLSVVFASASRSLPARAHMADEGA